MNSPSINDLIVLSKVANKDYFNFASVYFKSGLQIEEVEESLINLKNNGFITESRLNEIAIDSPTIWKVIKHEDWRHSNTTTFILMFLFIASYVLLSWIT